MKTLLLSIVSLFASHLASAQLAPADDKAIRAVIAHWDSNLNNHHFQDMTTYTTKDVNWIAPAGDSFHGQQQVVQRHQTIFDQIYKGVPLKSSNVTVRAITPEVAVVNEEMAIGVSYPPDGVNRGTNKVDPWRAMSLMVLVKNGGHWQITSAAITPINEKIIKQSQAMVSAKK
ncbi:SgcJ/EcaC family oxidoreductase [Hymenobacter sp. HMF4947]|uniref:SgcJ/EcaC family oxidoreductase n=1 Tax=Hymenobacter ginkgonis TaxID=2682976 RepID=A0A7K1TFZ6_9BACT|nr:SgcJ/EcaC family oxidoreductase [Hymenobacter ginkgonis]MVN77232.1 SgcJ/EcaC family oxidoreductase [Hymenobacter ginkgonis]